MSNFKLFYKIAEVDQNINVCPVFLKKPVIVDLMEIDKELNIKCNPNYIRYFKLPKMQDYPLDLNMGFKDYVFRNDGFYTNKLRKVFHYLMEHCDGDAENESSDQVGDKAECPTDEEFEVISHRGALTALLMAPLGTRYDKSWTILATCHNKKLYLYKPGRKDGNARDSTATHHFKFAQYCFTDDPNQDPDASAPIHEDEQMYCIYRSKLKNINLIYSAEINGILSDTKLDNVKNYEELNKCRFVHTKLMKNNLRNWRTNFRIQKWWPKSYFAAVNDVYVGFKSGLGFVGDPVQHIVLHELVREQKWSPKVCSAFLYKILTKINKEMKDVNCPYTTYEFRFDSSSSRIEFKRHEGKTEKTFLTEEYIQHITK